MGGSAGAPATTGLVHRFTFGGSGTTVTDSAGTANGTVMNATLQSGDLVLAGGTSDQYVNLPVTLLSGLTSATFEIWVTWTGGAAWQRIFDFGDNDGAGPGSQGANGTTYLFLTPKALNNTGRLRVAYSLGGPAMETQINAAAALPSAVRTHLAVVIDDDADRMTLYLDGASAGQATLSSPLSSLNVENAWLGRSQFQGDPEFGGTIHEFRIFSVARSAAQITASYTAGPDAAPAP